MGGKKGYAEPKRSDKEHFRRWRDFRKIRTLSADAKRPLVLPAGREGAPTRGGALMAYALKAQTGKPAKNWWATLGSNQ